MWIFFFSVLFFVLVSFLENVAFDLCVVVARVTFCRNWFNCCLLCIFMCLMCVSLLELVCDLFLLFLLL